MTSRIRALLPGALCVAVLVSSCSTLEPPRDPAVGPLPGTSLGGVLRVGITEPGAIDPMSTTTTAGRLIAATMCDTLLIRDPHTNQLREGIADTWVEASNGSFVTLRPMHNVVFNDGTPLQATDISFTMRQLVARVNDSPYAALGQPFTGGVIARSSGNQQDTRPDDLLVDSGESTTDLAQPLNDYDVQVQSQVNNSNTAGVFAETALAPIAEDAFEADTELFRSSPVCVGPYRLETPRRPGDDVITLVRSEGYHGNHLGFSNGGAGYASRIEFRIYPTSADVDQAYADGDIDIAQVLPRPFDGPVGAMPLLEEEPVIEPPIDPADLVRGDPTGVDYLGLAPQIEGAWNHRMVRQALSMVLDRQALARALGPFAEPATGFLPAALEVREGRRGRDPGRAIALPVCEAGLIPDRPDPEGARALLEEAGIDLTGLTLDFEVALPEGDATQASYARLIKAQIEAALDVEVELLPTEWLYYKERLTDGAGAFSGAFRTAWGTSVTAPVPTYNDPWLYLRSLFTSEGAGAGNLGGWGDPALDTALKDFAGTSEQGEQERNLARAGEILCTQMPTIPLVATAPVWRVRAETLGSALGDIATGTDGQLLLREIYVRP